MKNLYEIFYDFSFTWFHSLFRYMYFQLNSFADTYRPDLFDFFPPYDKKWIEPYDKIEMYTSQMDFSSFAAKCYSLLLTLQAIIDLFPYFSGSIFHISVWQVSSSLAASKNG